MKSIVTYCTLSVLFWSVQTFAQTQTAPNMPSTIQILNPISLSSLRAHGELIKVFSHASDIHAGRVFYRSDRAQCRMLSSSQNIPVGTYAVRVRRPIEDSDLTFSARFNFLGDSDQGENYRGEVHIFCWSVSRASDAFDATVTNALQGLAVFH